MIATIVAMIIGVSQRGEQFEAVQMPRKDPTQPAGHLLQVKGCSRIRQPMPPESRLGLHDGFG